MNRMKRRLILSEGRKAIRRGETDFNGFFQGICNALATEYHEPMTEGERALSAKLVAYKESEQVSWYHGGMIGREVGDFLLPASETGADPRGLGDGIIGRKDFVYITSSRTQAQGYAEKAAGCVYRVMPMGDIHAGLLELRGWMLARKATPEARRALKSFDTFHEFTCTRAMVMEVLP